MIPLDECHIAKKRDSDSKWSFLHIQIMNFKEVAVELLGSQNLPSSWAGSHVLGCDPGQGGGVCVQLSRGETCWSQQVAPFGGKTQASRESESP